MKINNTSIFLIIFTLLSFLNGCKEKKLTANQIIDKSIKVHGGLLFNSSSISFDFRDKHYSAKRQNGLFEFTREFSDTNGNAIKDVLNNTSFTRYTNNAKTDLTDERTNAYSNSINSVIYFALLPYGLNDKAVRKELMGEVKIKNKYYYKIKITFSQDGGGEDFEDIFVYWIEKENYTLDYLAYLYHVNGGGTRFREAVNVRVINGISFSDYINYGTEGLGYDIENYDVDFEKGNLKKVSEIKLKNVKVKKLKHK